MREQQMISQVENTTGYYLKTTTNGNPPVDADEQAERMVHVYHDAYALYGNQSNVDKYIVYLYLSHYVDNPNYNRNSPNFDSIYADVLTSSDISAYESFISNTKFSGIANDVKNFASAVYEIQSLTDAPTTLSDIGDTGRVVTLNTVNLVKDLSGLPNDLTNINTLIYNVIHDNYSSGASAETIIQTTNDSLGSEQVETVVEDYIDLCVTGFLAVLATTPPLVGFGISMTVFYYDFCSSILNKARLAALQYSYSSRVALRLEKVLFG